MEALQFNTVSTGKLHIDQNLFSLWAFDLDGLLIASNGIHDEIFQDFCDRHNLPNDLKLNGTSAEQVLEKWLESVEPKKRERAETTVRACIADYREKCWGTYEERVKEFTLLGDARKIFETIKTLREEIKSCIVTNSSRQFVNILDGEFSIRSFVDAVFVRERFDPDRKPHPRPYRLPLKKFHKQPENAVAFEDSVAGATSAIRAEYGLIVFVNRKRKRPKDIQEEIRLELGKESFTLSHSQEVVIVNSLDDVEILGV